MTETRTSETRVPCETPQCLQKGDPSLENGRGNVPQTCFHVARAREYAQRRQQKMETNKWNMPCTRCATAMYEQPGLLRNTSSKTRAGRTRPGLTAQENTNPSCVRFCWSQRQGSVLPGPEPGEIVPHAASRVNKEPANIRHHVTSALKKFSEPRWCRD